MKKILVLLLCLMVGSSLWAQENTVLGTGALGSANAPKYAVQKIQLTNQGNYSVPTLNFGSHDVQKESLEVYLSNFGASFFGMISSVEDLSDFVPTVVGGHGTGATIYLYLSWFDGVRYYYEVYTDSPGIGYLPEVTLSPVSGTPVINTEFYENEFRIIYNDPYKTNLYTVAPIVNISFGGAVGIAVLESTASNGGNTAIGYQALHGNSSGYENTALGNQSLYLSTGRSNLGLGYLAGSTLTTGSNNVLVGKNAGNGLTEGSGNLFIGNGNNISLDYNLNNSVIITDGVGSPRIFIGNSGQVKIGYDNNFVEEGGFKLRVNGGVHSSSYVFGQSFYTWGQVSFMNGEQGSHNFLFFNPDPNTFQMRAVVNANSYPAVFSVDKASTSMTFYAPTKGVPAVNGNEFVTLDQLGAGQTLGANISGSASFSSNLSNSVIDHQDLTSPSIVPAGHFRAMNGANIVGAPSTDYWNILSARHNNASNDYRMEIAGSFFNPNDIRFRNTNNNAAQGWNTFFHSGNIPTVRAALGLPASGGWDLQAITDNGNSTSHAIKTGGLMVSGTANSYRELMFMTNGSLRWDLHSIGAESGANVGSSLYLSSYDDTGAYLGTVFSIDRGNNIMNFQVRPRVNGSDIVAADGGTYNVNLSGSAHKWNNNTFDLGEVANPTYFVTGLGGAGWGYSTASQIRGALAPGLQEVLDKGATTTTTIQANAVGANLKLGGVAHSGGLFQQTGGDNLIYLSNWGDPTKSIVLNPVNGNVGIGTTGSPERLAVNGKIRAREIKVEPSGNWPDYVFEQGYQLPSLADIEAFIKANKHLPEVPSAKEVEQHGLALGEMNKVLLKKVEELTLHLIEKEKQLKATNDRVDELAEILKKLLENNRK